MKTALIGITSAAWLLLATSTSQAITIGFEPATQEVRVGTSVDERLVISGLGDGTAPSLSTFDLNISFDTALLAFSGVTFGDPNLGDQLDLLGFGSITSVNDSIAGTVNLFELSLDDPSDLDDLQAGSFTLAVLSFNALSAGTTVLDISVIDLGDALGGLLVVDTQSGSVMVSSRPVPEPSSLLLICIGLLGMCCRRQFLR